MRAFFRDAVTDITNRVTASRIISKATSSDKLELDEEEAAEVAAFANTTSPVLVVSNVKSRLESKTPASQYLTMKLIEYLVDNCASSLHDELARDVALHQRLIVLAASLQEVEPGATRSAIRVRLEARRLLLELSRTFRGCSQAQSPLEGLGSKFETTTKKKLERAVLMDGKRIRFRPINEEDVRLISPRGNSRYASAADRRTDTFGGKVIQSSTVSSSSSSSNAGAAAAAAAASTSTSSTSTVNTASSSSSSSSSTTAPSQRQTFVVGQILTNADVDDKNMVKDQSSTSASSSIPSATVVVGATQQQQPVLLEGTVVEPATAAGASTTAQSQAPHQEKNETIPDQSSSSPSVAVETPVAEAEHDDEKKNTDSDPKDDCGEATAAAGKISSDGDGTQTNIVDSALVADAAAVEVETKSASQNEKNDAEETAISDAPKHVDPQDVAENVMMEDQGEAEADSSHPQQERQEQQEHQSAAAADGENNDVKGGGAGAVVVVEEKMEEPAGESIEQEPAAAVAEGGGDENNDDGEDDESAAAASSSSQQQQQQQSSTTNQSKKKKKKNNKR